MRFIAGCTAACLGLVLAGSSPAATILVTEIGKVDLSSLSADSNAANYIGTNPSAVTWNGTDAWIGGYNNGAAGLKTGIMHISNVLTTPTFDAAALGQLATVAGRGMTSLSVQGTNLAAALDTGGGSGDAVRLFNTLTNTLSWRIGDAGGGNDTTRRGNGSAFDPGFNAGGTNQGVAYLSIGSGRRHVLTTATGAYINGQNSGAVINFTPGSTTWRDLDFDPATGDMYTRESNRVGQHIRNADNNFSSNAYIGGLTAIGTVDQENITFANVTGVGKSLFLNDHISNASLVQPFTSIIKALDTTGGAQSLYWDFSTFGNPADGSGAYDVSFNAASQTLAVSDFGNRQLYIFSVLVPEPASVSLLGIAGLLLVRRRK